MLRELVDTAFLEDFVDGLSRTSGLRVAAYDDRRRLLAGAPPTTRWAKRRECLPAELPGRLEPMRLPADEPPAQLALCESQGAAYVVAPVFADQQVVGFVVVGEVRRSDAEIPAEIALAAEDGPALRAAFDELLVLHPTPDARPIRACRWAARLLGRWCRRELRVATMAEELALVGDTAQLISGQEDLQTVLDQIVAETAQVMRCRFCSLRLYDRKTDQLTIKAVHNLSRQYVEQGVVRRADNPIDAAALGGAMVYVDDATSDPRYRSPDDARHEGIVSLLGAGLHYRGRPVGVMRVYTDRRQRFSQSQRELLSAVAAQAATAVVNAQMLEERLRAAEVERELRLAGEVQQRMLAMPIPEHAGVEVARLFSPCSHVAGDFCDFVTLCDGRLTAIVADVVGKGVPAALLGASVRGALRAGAEACLKLDELFDRLNQHVCRETTPAEFVTMLAVAVDRDAGQIRLCSAGHEPLLICRDDEVLTVDEAGLVLGVDPRESYAVHTVDVRAGDFLLLYTDGAIDATNFAGVMFGRERLLASARQYAGLDPDAAVRNLVWDIRRFVGLAEQADDLTLVGMKIH